jgi:phasin family protein
MATSDKSPFEAFDFSKLDLQKIFADFKMPGVDVPALLSAQQKNIAALTQANQHAVEGVEVLARRQLEILQQAIKGAADAAKQVVTAGGPMEAAAKQAELAKAAFEQAVANMRDMAEMVSNSNKKAFDAISKRVAEGLEELKQQAQKP